MALPVPETPRAFIPNLVLRDAARAIDFYVRAFGAVERYRLVEPAGRIGYAELAIGQAEFTVCDEYPELGFRGPQGEAAPPVSLTLYVDDVDGFVARAVAAGAALERPVADEFYGDRTARIRDPFGHRWSFQTRREHLTPEEMQRRFDRLFDEA